MTAGRAGPNRATTRAIRKAAKRPPARTIEIVIEDGDFAGWACTARGDFPAGVLVEIGSGEIGRIMDSLELIIIDHNFPDSSDQIATALREVDPYDGLLTVAGAVLEAIGKLPNR